MYLHMNPLNNPLITHPLQTGREMLIEPYQNWQFQLINNPDRQCGSSSVLTLTRTWSNGPESLLTLPLGMLNFECCIIKPSLISILPGREVPCGIYDIPGTMSRVAIRSLHVLGWTDRASWLVYGWTTDGGLNLYVPYVLSHSQK